MLALILLLPLTFAAVAFTFWLAPHFNALFSRVWQDPTDRQRAEVLARMNELYVDGHLPEEAAVMVASKELDTTEEKLLDVVGAMSASDIKAVLSGRKNVVWALLDAANKSLRKGTSGGRR